MMSSPPPRILKAEFDNIPLPVFDCGTIDLLLDEDCYRSGNFGAMVDGSLLTWTVNIGFKINKAICDSRQTPYIAKVSHQMGAPSGLNLTFRAKPTDTIDINQRSGGNVVVS